MPTQQIAVQSSQKRQMDLSGSVEGAGGNNAVELEPPSVQCIALGTTEDGHVETDVDNCDIVTETQNMCDSSESSTETVREPHVLVEAVIVTDRPCSQVDQSETLSQTTTDINTVNPVSRDSDQQSPAKGDMSGPTDKRASMRSGKAGKKEKPTPFKKKDSVAKETLHPNSPTPMSTERCDSSLSNNSADLCRICQCDTCEIQNDSPLVAPCLCTGSLRYIHQACLQKWIKSSDKMSCELCQYEYLMTKKTKPFREWERLDMTPAERRKVVCSVTFHVIAITCVVWSLFVLIDRTTEEVEAGSLLWPFWTKLIVVAIGFTGGVVFMYVQCKMYLTLCKKWRMYNKVIIISSISDVQRERAQREGKARRTEKEAQLEAAGGQITNFDVFNIVNESESV